jgi:hypothetical protein
MKGPGCLGGFVLRQVIADGHLVVSQVVGSRLASAGARSASRKAITGWATRNSRNSTPNRRFSFSIDRVWLEHALEAGSGGRSNGTIDQIEPPLFDFFSPHGCSPKALVWSPSSPSSSTRRWTQAEPPVEALIGWQSLLSRAKVPFAGVAQHLGQRDLAWRQSTFCACGPRLADAAADWQTPGHESGASWACTGFSTLKFVNRSPSAASLSRRGAGKSRMPPL